MSKSIQNLAFSDLVGEFLGKAETACKEHELRLVCSAIQYAAARMNVLEANSNCDCLACHKDDATEWYTNEYKVMFEKNVDEIMEHLDCE